MQVIILLHRDDLKSIKFHLTERQSLQVTPVYVAIYTLSGREPRMGEFTFGVLLFSNATRDIFLTAIITPDCIHVTPSRPLSSRLTSYVSRRHVHCSTPACIRVTPSCPLSSRATAPSDVLLFITTCVAASLGGQTDPIRQ